MDLRHEGAGRDPRDRGVPLSEFPRVENPSHYVALRTVSFYLHVVVYFLLTMWPKDCFVLFARCCVLFTHYLSPRTVLFYLHVAVCFVLTAWP